MGRLHLVLECDVIQAGVLAEMRGHLMRGVGPDPGSDVVRGSVDGEEAQMDAGIDAALVSGGDRGTLSTAADESRTRAGQLDLGEDKPRVRRARLVADGGGLENRYGW